MTEEVVDSSLPRTSIILINWNNYEDSAECIASLQAQECENIDIFLVDNGSTDGSLARLRSEFPEIRYISLEENLGFPAANNAGIIEALERGAEYVFLLNNDTIVPEDKDVVGTLVEHLENNQNVGIVAPLVMYYPETDVIWFSEGQVYETTGKIRHTRMDEMVTSQDLPETISNEWISGCAMMIPSEVFETVGLFNGGYFIRLSDTEFSLRVAAAGYDLRTDTRVRLYHKESSSSGEQFDLSYYQARNRFRIIRDHFPTIATVFFFWWLVKATANRVFQAESRAIADLLTGTIDGIVGKDGKAVPPSERIK